MAPLPRTMLAMALALGLASVAMSGAGAVGVGQTCGGLAGFVCDRGLWCDWPGGKCRAGEARGRCVEIPGICPKTIGSVCGCDKRTYGNDCERVRAGVQKDHDGACR
jgi:hypothetical protein